MVISMASVSMGVMGTKFCWATPALHWPWDGWLDIAAGELALPLSGELTPTPLKKDGPTSHHGRAP